MCLNHQVIMNVKVSVPAVKTAYVCPSYIVSPIISAITCSLSVWVCAVYLTLQAEQEFCGNNRTLN